MTGSNVMLNIIKSMITASLADASASLVGLGIHLILRVTGFSVIIRFILIR